MKIPLTDFEVDTLNKVIHTHTFGEFVSLEIALQKLVDDEKDNLINSGKADANNFVSFRMQVINNITQFLLRNEFIGVREGGVYFLTEKGQYLQQQDTLQKYIDWELARESQLIADLHTIETQGYLEKDQTFKHEKQHLQQPVVAEDKKKYFGWYVLIIVIIIILCAIGKLHKW